MFISDDLEGKEKTEGENRLKLYEVSCLRFLLPGWIIK